MWAPRVCPCPPGVGRTPRIGPCRPGVGEPAHAPDGRLRRPLVMSIVRRVIKMRRLYLTIIAIFVFISACDSWEAVDPLERDLEPHEQVDGAVETPVQYTYIIAKGHYVNGFENSYFYPCGTDEVWWVTPTTELINRYGDISTKYSERLYVKLSGKVSESGRYGHLGGGRRNFIVEGVFEIRKPTNIDCK